MRLLLDECLPRQLKRALVGHDVTTVAENLSRIPLRIVVLRAVSNDMSDLLPLVPEALQTLEQMAPGTVVEISE